MAIIDALYKKHQLWGNCANYHVIIFSKILYPSIQEEKALQTNLSVSSGLSNIIGSESKI